MLNIYLFFTIIINSKYNKNKIIKYLKIILKIYKFKVRSKIGLEVRSDIKLEVELKIGLKIELEVKLEVKTKVGSEIKSKV